MRNIENVNSKPHNGIVVATENVLTQPRCG